MAQRSSIDRLPPEVRGEVDKAVAGGATIDQIVELLLDLSEQGKLKEPPSRSAVGRYSRQYREVAAQQRDLASVATAFAGDFASEDNLQGRMMIQLLTSLLTRAAMTAAQGEDEALDVKGLANLARAVKDTTAASMIDVTREARIRDEAAKAATKAAAEAAESEIKASGASQETIDRVKRRILGLST